MPFRKPLRAFVSYSHIDSGLFREFKAQVKSLEDDGIVKVWHDRQISAGMKWDSTIRRKLDQAHLFIALTSADFNESKYIEGVEMKRAEERHLAGTCRLVPILLRNWKRPKQLDQYQFLPKPLRAVASTKNRADVWTAIVEQIEAVADEMISGRWPQKAAKTSTASSANPLYRDLPYLCDWKPTIGKIEASLKSSSGPRLPSVIVLVATRDDCYEKFINRIATRELSKALELGELQPEIKRFEWLETFDDEIHNALEADRSWPLEKKLRAGLTVLNSMEVGDNWTADKERLLTDFLRYWRSWGALPGLRGLVSVVSIAVTRKSPDLVDTIEKLVQREAQSNVKAVVIEVPPIPAKSAIMWPSLSEVRKRCREGTEQDMSEEILGFYSKLDEDLPMGVLAPKLLDLVQRYQIEA
jgi:hypothetical protein